MVKESRLRMTPPEVALARKMYHEKGKAPKDIADVFDRDRTCLTGVR